MKECLKIKEDLQEGIVVKRTNRFVVNVLQGEKIRVCHLHDTGRLKELIYPGNSVLFIDKKSHLTDCLIIAAKGSNGWVITNTLLHRELAMCLFPKNVKVIPEVKVFESRVDFFIKPDLYVETKGCTLIKNGVALFPDAPTERGKKHILTLIKAVEAGYRAELLFLIMHEGAKCFYPNYITDPEFEKLFFKALEKGVKVRSAVFSLKGKAVYYIKQVKVCRSKPRI
ncbi:MAG: DNA/RNA nuclease SfsA [Nitrososphaeria archaeon]